MAHEYFPPHGVLKIKIEGNVILIDSLGPWNIEYLRYLHKQLIIAVSQVDYSNYAVLITPRGDAVSVHEGIEYHLSFIKKNNSAKAIALNLEHCATPLLTEKICTDLYTSANIKHKFFDTYGEAKVWVEQQL